MILMCNHVLLTENPIPDVKYCVCSGPAHVFRSTLLTNDINVQSCFIN